MSFATIVFTDIVSFSKRKATEQKKLVTSFNEFIAQETQIASDKNILQKNVVALPTGDGMAVAFLSPQNTVEAVQFVITFCINLHCWAMEQEVKLRIGVHYGAIQLLRDINGQTNICGKTINDAQRIMDGGGAGQVLFSVDYFDECVEEEAIIQWFSKKQQEQNSHQKLKLIFSDTFDIIAKHDHVIGARQLFMVTDPSISLAGIQKLEPSKLQQNTPKFWSNADPEGKMRMQLNLTRAPKNINNDFGEKLLKAEEVALILLTGENLIERLESGEPVFGKQLAELIVLMPARLDGSKTLDPEVYNEKSLSEFKQRWLNALRELRKKYPKSSIKLGYFTEPPYFGASFLDWRQEGGQIHISPYVWGTQTSANPSFDVRWVGKAKPPVYKAYIEGLRTLNNSTSNVLEKN